jgi:hypothetical protein
MRIDKADQADVWIHKRGPADYVVHCDTCGWRVEMDGSLMVAKAEARVHRIEHEEVSYGRPRSA